jgi:K+-transporting ATPase ATPase C chain
MKELRTAISLTLLFALLTGLVFPVIVWLGSQLFFPTQANGSLVADKNGKIVGSLLIGQNFTLPKYFHPRPSAAGSGYDGANSSGTNLGPISSKLIVGIKDDPSTPDADESYSGVRDLAATYREENGLAANTLLPADAVTRSGSGLDPEISPQNAHLQAARVAAARGLVVEKIEAAIQQNTEQRFLAIWGEPRVNVLKLNMFLDSIQ